ncbi:hypothetical protein D9M71_818430 [compost metagenome]
MDHRLEQFKRVTEAWIDRLDLCAQLRQPFNRLIDHSRHLWIDVHIAEIRTVGDAQATQVGVLR